MRSFLGKGERAIFPLFLSDFSKVVVGLNTSVMSLCLAYLAIPFHLTQQTNTLLINFIYVVKIFMMQTFFKDVNSFIIWLIPVAGITRALVG